MKENIFYIILKRFMVFLLLVVSFVCVSCDKGADKSDLQGTIATVETYNASEYTNDSYAALQEALDKANAVLNNDKATQEEVNKAIEDLNTAINNLVKKQAVSKIALQTYYVRVKDTANAGYTEESYSAFQAAVTAAKAVLDKADATQEEVDAALVNLRTTFNALAVNQKSRLQNSYNTVKGLQSKDFINYKYYDYVASQVAELKDEIDAVLLTEDGDFELYADKLDKLVSLTKLAANYSLDFSAEQGNNGWNYYCGTSFSWTFPELTFGPQGIYEPEFDGEKYVGDSEQVLSSTIINPGQNHNNKPAFPSWTASESGIFNITFTLDMDIENEQFSKLSVRTLLMDKNGGFKYIVFEGFDLGTGGEKVKVFTAENFAIEAGEKVYLIIHDEGNTATEVKVDITIEACTKYTAILSENVEAYSKIQGKYYEQNSFDALQTKLEAATAVLNNLNSTQAEINAMVVELENAKQALVKVSADKSELEEQITLANALDGDYSKATSDALSAALDNAKEVFDNDAATQEQVDAALEELKTAVKGLVDLSELRAKSTLLTEYEASDFASSKYYATYIEQINSVKALVAELLAKEDVTTDEITAIIPVIDDVSRLTTVIADSTIDFSSVQVENGFSYLTHTGNNWDWGTSYGPLAIEELVWNRTTLQYESEYGHALSAGNIVIPQAGNEHNTLVKWVVPNDGTYSLRYNLNVGQTVGTGRLSVRLMLFNADGSFAERMLAETYEIGTNGKNYDVTLNVNDAVLLEGQYVLIVLYDEGTEAASGTFNFRVYYTELYNTKLNALIAKAEAVDGTLYTTASYEALTTALNAAKAQVNATEQTVINSAVHTLEAALDGLKVVSISTDELSTEIEAAEALLDGDYTAASVAALSAKIDEAKLVVENPESQEAVDAALQAVLVARGQLVDLSALRSVAESLAVVKAEHFVSSTYVEAGMAQVEAAKASVSAILAKEDATKDEVNAQVKVANDALTVVYLVADMNQDFSKVQGENGWRYQTNTAHVWQWGPNYGPTEIVDLVWNPETQQYESAAGSVVKGNFMAFPQTWNNAMTLLRWTAAEAGTYSMKYTLTVPNNLEGRLGIRIMLFNANGTFAENMLAETYDVGQNGQKLSVTLTRNDLFMTEGQYILAVVYDENTPNATATVNMQISSISLYKGRLNALIAKAEAVDANLYTPASYEALTTALTAAKAKVEATEQVEINKAVQALEKAMAELTVLTIDTDALSAAITEFEALLDGDYTAASVAALSAKIDEAKLVVENPESQEAVDAALQALQVAKGGLVDLSALRSASESLAAIKAEHFVSSSYVEAGMAQVEAAKASVSAILAKEDASKDEVNAQINIANESLALVNLVADMNQDFSKVQGENGWYYVTNNGNEWAWGANYGPKNIEELTWDAAANAYVSEYGNKVSNTEIYFPQTANDHMTLVKWVAVEVGNYSFVYNINVGNGVGGGRLSVRVMLFNADGTFTERMLTETYDIGTNGNKCDVTLTANNVAMTAGQYVVVAVYDENSCNATATVNMQVSTSGLYKTRLNALIVKVEAVDGNLYTPASYEALTTALTAAKAQVEATEQVEINKAVQALEKAIAELTVLTIDTDALSATITEFEALLDGDYTAASVAALSAKIDEAKLVVENPESQEAVDAALQALQVAKGGLVDLSALRSASESLAAIKAEHFVSSSYVEAGMAQVEAAKASVSAVLAKEDATKDEINAQIIIANNALTVVNLIADMNQDFSKVQGENGWRYQTNTAHVWQWGPNYGPTEIVDLVWNNTTQQYESAVGSVVKGSHMAFPQTWNNAMTLLRWTAGETGTYNMKYTLTVPNNLAGRLGIRIMLFNANGTFAENMLAETYDVGQNGQKLSVTLTRNDLFMTEGQYILAVVYDENTPNATATVNMQISSSSSYKGRLNALIAKAEAVDANLYTPASYEALTTALTAAKAQVEATEQVEINKAVQALEKAMAELTLLSIDTSALSAAIEEAQALLEGDYTVASYSALRAQVESGQVLVVNPTSKDAVDAKTLEIYSSINSLVSIKELKVAYDTLNAVTSDDFVNEAYVEDGLAEIEAAKASVSAILVKEDATKDEIYAQIQVANDALALVNLVADMNKDFSSTQGENGWYYVTNDGHVWDWGANYGPQNLVELTWDEEQNAYVSEFGNKVTSDGISYPLTGNNHMTLVKWTASADGTYDLKYNLNVGDGVGAGRLSVRIMRFNADGTFVTDMVAETYDIGTNGNKCDVTLTRNDIVMTAGQYIVVAVYDENSCSAEGTCNLTISK